MIAFELLATHWRNQPGYIALSFVIAGAGIVVGWCARRIYDVRRGRY